MNPTRRIETASRGKVPPTGFAAAQDDIAHERVYICVLLTSHVLEDVFFDWRNWAQNADENSNIRPHVIDIHSLQRIIAE